MQRIEWLEETGVPRCVGALLDGLRFDLGPVKCPDCDAAAWESAVYYLHRNQLTLIVREVLQPQLPVERQAAFDGYYQANALRLSRLRAATREVIEELDRTCIETVLLKGFARAGEYLSDPGARMHYDIDLYCPAKSKEAAAVLRGIGYQPIAGAESDAAGHLAPLARKTSWQWRGDFFDLETPIHVELHELLWVPRIEGFSFPGLGDWWARRENIALENDFIVYTLSRHDTLALRCLHLLRHLLRGDIRASGVYEIAYFLHHNCGDDEFWSAWLELYPEALRQGQAVCFALAVRWFGSAMNAIPARAVEGLPESVRRWMHEHAASPVESFFSPAKHELTLHFALVDAFGGSASAKLRIAMRRLFPMRHTPRMWEGRGAYLARLGTRAVYHLKALAPTLFRVVRSRR